MIARAEGTGNHPPNVVETSSDILLADALCNPVNLRGAMGRGLAAAVASRWPGCLGPYRDALRTGTLRSGAVAAWQRPDGGWILQVPTKDDWRDDSPIQLVEASIDAIGPTCERHAITRISVPPLGCGLGGLRPERVRPSVERAARRHPGMTWVLHRWTC